MATKIKVSSLPSELQNLLEADRKKRGGMTEQERADELSSYLNKRKSAGTLLSGTLTNEEKMDYTKRDSDKVRNRALAEMAATAEKNELVHKKSDSVLSSPSMGEVQRGDGSQTTDLRPGETRRGNKPEASLLEKIQYVQARGADAFASANENLNIFGEAIAAGINSGIESAKNRDTLDVVLSSAAKGAANSLDKSAEENVNERARQAIDGKYAHVVNSKGASVAADLVSSVNQMIPAVMLPGAAGTALLAATNFPESYVSARNNGADQKQAAAYGAVNAAINSVGEQLIGGIASKGTGLAGKAANAISRGASSRLAANAMNSIAKSPLAKTALSAVAKSAGEGAEEVVQSLLSTAAERATYNPEAKVDAKKLAYEGLLGGLMGGAFQAASLPATYQAYRSDYDTVNNFSLAGEAVANESDVEIIRNVGESIVKGADEILSDNSLDADQKQRAQYIKSGVEAVMKKLDESSADIIMGNQQKYAALEKLISSDRSNVVENLAVLVRDVSGATSGNKDAINKTVDFVRGEIQNANNILATSSDPNVRQEAAVNLQNYKDVDRTLRTFRKQINKALADLPAQSNAEMQTPAQTEPKAQAQTEAAAETASAPETTKPRQTVTKSVLKGYGIDTEVPASKFPEYLLNQLQTGKITQEEADALDAEYEAKYPKKAAETKLNAATAAYQKGEISEAQYDEQYSQYESELNDIDSRMSSETFPVRLRPVYEEVVQPVSEAEAQTEQTVDDSTNAADTTSVNAGEGSAPVRENVADIAGDEAQTAEEVAERLAEEGYSFRDIRDQINAYRAENTAESNAEAARLEEADRILVKKNRANVQKVANAYAPILKRFGINGVVVEDMPVGRNAAFDRKTNTIHLSSRISDSGAVGRFIVHEFTHRGTKIDMSLADSIVSAMESRKGGRGYISEAVIRNAYADQLSGLSAEEADSIVREERAAHFMERIMEDVNVLDEFRDDRTFLRKILDAIRDFFARNNPDKQEQIRLRNIEKKINDLLKAANVDAEVKTGGRSETNVGDGDIRMSRDIENDITAEDVETLRTIPRKSVNEFASEEIQKTEPWARKFYKELGTKSPFFRAWFGDWRSSDPTEIDITEVSELPETLDLSSAVERGTFSNADTNWNITVGSLGINDTVSHARGENIYPKMLTEIRGIIGNAVLLDTEILEKSSKKKHIQTAFMHKLYAPVNYNGKSYIAKVSVEEYGADGNEGRRFYNLKAIKMSPAAGGFDSTGAYSEDAVSVADLFSFVKQYDLEFRPKESSEVVNNDGTPKVVYHGTNAEFSVFDLSQSGKNFGEISEGFFFFTNKKNAYPDSAEDYANSAAQRDGAAKVYEVYLDIKNPLHLDSRGYYTPTAYFDTNADDIYEQYLDGDYDGVIIENSDKSADDSAIYLVDDSYKIKSATDNIGTFDPDNPDIRYSRDIETPEQKHIRRLEEQNEYLKKQYQSQTTFGWAKTVSPAQRKQFAGTIAADIPGVSADEVSAAIKPVYDLFEKPKRGAKDTPEVRLAEARRLAQEAAERLVDGAIETEINPMYEQYNDLRNFLRTTPIKRTISAEEFGGAEAYSKWRDGNRGLLRVSTNPDARGIDSVYKEISAQYPEFFPEDITDMAEMLRRMGDVAALLKTEAGNKTVKVNPLEDVRDSFLQDVANRILYGFDQLAKITPAAKYEYGGKVNERDVQRAYAEGMSSAAAREAQAYDSGLKEGRKQNDLEVQAAHQREDIQYQIFQRDFNQAVNNFNREIERQNKRIETLQKRIETRGQREQLAMAKKVVYGRLNRLNTMLTKPNRSKHIPQNLRAPIARLLEAVGTTYLPNGKTVQSGAMQDIQEKEYARFESESIRVVDEIATIIGANKTSENNAVSQQYLDKLTENVLRLKEMHAEMNPNSPDDVVLPPDLMSTKKIEYVKQLNRILAMAENYIKDSNTVFLAGKATSAKDFSERMISDLREKTVPHESNRLRKFFHDVGYEFVSADLFFEMVGESGNDIMRQYRKAQTTQAKCEEEYAQYIFGKTGGKYSTNKAGFNGDLIDISANGKKLKVTRAQLMQLYMTWKRPAGRRHLRFGGAIFVNEAGVELKENTILINNATYDELISHLSDEDKRIADALGSFMVRRCAEWGNYASMQMYGYRMFEDSHYFPMDVSNNVLPANWDSMDEFYRLENAGMTKSIKENASAPLRMTDIFDVADFHVRTMAAYAAYAPVSNDIQRILNMPGVNEAVNVGMGKKGAKYLETLVKTIASNKVRTGDMSDAARPLQFFMNAYKRQAVSFNISTALKQPLSIVRALNDIDAKYILKAPASMTGKEYSRAYNAMIENSGVAKMKMLGYSDTGFGKSLRQIYDTGYINESGIIRGSAAGTKAGRIAVKTYDKITDAGMWVAGKMDEATWVRLWRACELEVSDRHKGLSAKEKTAKVAERFNEIVGRSQVVDTVLDTSPLMRNNAMAILTPFMNEPTKALATIITAADAYRDGKAGSKKKLVKAIGLVALNNLLLEPIVSALMTMWRDEEDDTENIADFSKKFLKLYVGVDLDGTSVASVMTSNAVSGVLGSVPILQIFYNTFSDSMQNYSNEKIDTAALSNLIRDTKNLIVNSRKEAVDRVETNYKLFSDFLGSAAAAIGIPLPTLRRQASAMVRTALEHTDSYDLQWRYAKILYNLENSSARTQKQFYNILAAAYKANDVADYQYMLNDLKNTQTGKNTIGISWNKMKKYIEDRGGKYEIGSDLWLVGVQAEFNLSSFNPAMKVETMLGKIYKSAISEGVKNPERALPSTPALYSYNKVDENGNDVLDENGDPVKVEMTLAEYEDFIADVGKLSYNILLAIQGQGQFKNLSAEEQVYCLDKAYDFAARYYRSKFNPDYDLSNGGKWMAEVAKGNLDTTKISRAILNAERNRK